MRKKYWVIFAVAATIGMMGGGFSGLGELSNHLTVQAAEEAEEAASMTVLMSKESGCYENAFSLEITCEGAEKIYYTTDGSNPVTSTTRKEYTAPVSVMDRKGDKNVLAAVDPALFDNAYATYKNGVIGDKYGAPADSEVDKATVLKAVGVDASGTYGSVVTNTYFVGTMSEHIKGIEESCTAAGMPLSIMSISMEYDDLFDYESGIYVKGKLFDETLAAYSGNISSWNVTDVARGLNANYKQKGSDWERAAHIDYIESDGVKTECRLQQDCGIRIQGNYSRSDMQKGLRLYARADYGNKNFKYAFFGDELKDSDGNTIKKFKKLTLRNGGNAAFLAKYNDAYWQSLLKDTACETQGSRVCAVYLNGEYWGIYILQETYDDNYFENKYGVDKDSVVVYKGDAEEYECGYKLDEGTLPDGITDEGYYFDELMTFFKTHTDLTDEKDYVAFEKLVDVDSVMDFFAAEIWLNNKWDWPGKNWSMWKTNTTDETKPYADGRWRLCLYDLDFGGWSGSSEASTNTIKEDNYKPYGLLDMATDNQPVLCFAYLMTNESFRERFASRLKEMDSVNFEDEKAVALCTKYRDTYQPLYEQFFARFFGSAEAESKMKSALSGAGSYQAMTEFVKKRSNYIDTMLNWVQNFYETHTIYNSDSGDSSNLSGDINKIEPCKITAKKGKKKIRVKTVKKSTVTITLTKKIIVSGKKRVKKITVPASKNKSGIVTVKLASKLKKGMKVTVKVSKSGYLTKRKTVKTTD